MQKYMKSAMPFHGVQTPVRRKIAKEILKAHPIESAESWRKDLLTV